MKLLKRLLDKFGKAFVPRKIAPVLHSYLLKAGIHKVPYVLFGGLFYLATVLTAILYIWLIYPSLAKLGFWKIFLFTFFSWAGMHIILTILVILTVYFYLDLKIFKRTNAIDEMLPEFLQQVSSNLKGGMTFEKAMWNTINPRFKVLAVETAEIMKKVMTGTSTTDALKQLSKKYDSNLLTRTIELIISELESGGNITNMLDKMVKDLERMKQLKNEMTASVVGHMMMISAIVVVIAPMLFALSFHLMTMITGFLKNLAPSLTTSSASTPIKLTSGGITPSDFKMFSIIAISSISLIASFIVSVIEKGNAKSGVKYVPVYMGASVGFYFLFLGIISKFFSFI